MRSNRVPHLNIPSYSSDGDGIIWTAANECGSIRLDAFGIRSNSGADSRPSGLISVHNTFESCDRPHRTCWPPHFQGVVEARSQPQAECTQTIGITRNAPHPAAPSGNIHKIWDKLPVGRIERGLKKGWRKITTQCKGCITGIIRNKKKERKKQEKN